MLFRSRRQTHASGPGDQNVLGIVPGFYHSQGRIGPPVEYRDAIAMLIGDEYASAIARHCNAIEKRADFEPGDLTPIRRVEDGDVAGLDIGGE